MKLTNVKRVLGFESDTLEKRIKKGAKVDQSTLKHSIDVSYNIENNTLQMTLTAEEYSKWVDEGRKPGIGMPVKPLKEWIKRKKLTIKDVNGKQLKMTDSRINGLSYVINRKIREKGIKPSHFIERPVDLMLDTLGDRLSVAFSQDIENYILGNQ